MKGCTQCGACCRFLVMRVDPNYYRNDDIRNWVEIHGIKLEQKENGVWASIPLSCQHLIGDGSCGIYGQPERPKVCDEWPQSQADIDELDEYVGRKTCTVTIEQLITQEV